MDNIVINTVPECGGGELTIAAMDKYSRLEIGRKTYRFVRRCMRDPELRAKIKARAAELRAEAEANTYDDYNPYEEEAIGALAVFRLYDDQRQEAFSNWRGTIRDADTIRSDIKAIDQKIAQQEAVDQAAAEVARKEAIDQRYEMQDMKPWYEQPQAYLTDSQYTILPADSISPGTLSQRTPSQEMQTLLKEKKLLQEELDWSQYYYYADYASADNFEEMSKYVPQERKKRRTMDLLMDNYSDDASGWEDPLYEYINGNKDAGAYISNAAADYYGSDNALGSIYGRVTESKYESQQMDEPEVAIFNYLYATQGKAAAHAYYDYLQKDLNYRQRKAEEEYLKKYASEHPVAASVFSVATSPLKGLSYIGQLTDFMTTGEIDENAAYNSFSYTPSVMRSQVVEQMEANGNWGKVGSFAYQTGLSMADFLLTSALTGGSQAAALTIMGSGAAADTTIAAKDRGLSDGQAFALGTIAGIAEAAMESINMETVFKPDLLKDSIVKYMLKNAKAEGWEEVGTDAINLVADILISKEQSEWQRSIDEYRRQGMSDSKAIAKAFGDQALTMALDYGGGFISGGIMSGGTAVINAKDTKQLGKELGKLDLDEGDIQTFIETGLESAPGTASYQLAKEMQAKIDAGQPLSDYDLARLYKANVQAVQMEGHADNTHAENTAARDNQQIPAEPRGLQLPTLDDTEATPGSQIPSHSSAGNDAIMELQRPDGTSEPSVLQGLQLPSLEFGPEASQLGTENQKNVTQTQVNDTAPPAGVPLSIADQLRIEQGQNGGMEYDSTQRTPGLAAAQPGAGDLTRRGAGIPDGSAERNAGAGTTGQAGILAGSPEQRRSAWADRSRATVARQNYARSLRLEKVSSLDLGLQNGTETRNIQIVPQEYWDSEMTQLDNRIYNETGRHLTYVMGRIQIRGANGNVAYARGVITGDRIIVQADHLKIPMEQLADHEAYHAKVDFSNGRLNDEIRRHIIETFSEEEFRQALDKYIVGLRGVIDITDTHSIEEFDAAVRQIEEEIFADAYAGINAFSAGADRFTNAVNERMDQLHIGKLRDQDNGTEQPTGPPNHERYSLGAGSVTSYDGRSLTEDPEVYSYNFLTSQSPMKSVELPSISSVKDAEGRIAPANIAENGIKNALSVGTERAGKVYIRNRYTNRELQVTASAIRHGLNGPSNRLLTNARLGSVIGEIVQNAIPINALHNTSDGVEGTYAMAGYAFDQQGRKFVAIVTVEQRTDTVSEIDAYDVTHAISGRQKRGNQVDTKSQGVNPSMFASKINIPDLLQAVKSTYRSILSRDVLDKMGESISTDGYYTSRVRYSYAGENANGADLDALARAKEMQAAGVADETIRQQTGWHTGMDGKWRWEIDDSNMRYDSSGDLRGAESAKWAVEDSDEQNPQLGNRYSAEDDAYLKAVNSGDMKAARRMVDAAAERWGAYLNNDEANEVFHQDGRVRTFYHGTNTGDFTAFDSQLLGSSSGDMGWFGKGFYFAFSRGEAATYGDRVIPAYLKMRNPFDYSSLYKFKGSNKGAAEYARFAWAYNITKQFPDIAEGQRVWAYPDDAEEGSAVSWKQLTAWMDRIQKEKQFSVEKVKLSDGTTAWELRADPKKESITMAGGEIFEWTEYGMNQLFATEKDAKEPINQIGAYLQNVMGIDSIPRRTIEKIDFSGALLRAGYDGILQSMSGDEAVVFSPEQIKTSEPVTYDDNGNVIPLSKRFDTSSSDIRYSVDDAEQDPAQQKLAPKKKVAPVAESKPLIAKKDLRNTVLNLFSIPSGQRAEMGSMIDSYAERLIKNGSLTEEDRKAFLNRMYDSGVMVMPADDYSAFARSHIASGRIYVSDSVKADFGDDWSDIRRRAFAAGVYLVNDRSASGIDQWNAMLSAEDMLPGLFDARETDERSILERIIQVAEEGKDENLSLAEYTRRLSQQEGISEDEFLDNMERQLDWALRTFAEKARLEVHLRDRTGKKIAQEREKGSERLTRQRAKEAQRRAEERQARKDAARRATERRELRELQQKTMKQLQWLSKNRNRAPEELREAWNDVLGDIDLYAISAADEMRWSEKHNATWKDLAQMYKDAMKNDPNFLPSKELERIVARLDGTKIADMDLGALQDLYKAAVGLRTEFYNRNNVINDEMQRLFAEVYTDSKREIEAAPEGFTGKVMDKFLNLVQLTPMNVLQRMAGWDPNSAFYSMAKQLERGERDIRAYSVKAQKMLQDFLTEHEDWVKKADGQGKDAIWYEVEVPQLLELAMGDKPIFGPTVKVYMTPAQKVHMYLESKNLDNLRHMTGGRTFVDKDLYSKGKRQEALSQGRTIKLAPETVRKLVSDLTSEEMELAKLLDRYYNTFATQEINRVSNILYGYDKAMGNNYAPIYTNRNYTKTEFGVFDVTAEGVGNLKGRQYAVNPSYNISAFDAFERHVDQTARFCGMAIPARNWTTLMNWREKNNSTGDVITHKWGEESKKYISDLITTLQGGDDAKTDIISSGLSKLQSNYISAIFGTNPSIVLKQLGSIPLAGAYLDAVNMPKPAQIARIDRGLISKYTQELEWRTMGYATPETKQLKDNPNWTQTNKVINFTFGGGAITAMDGWAASVLWPWAENKVRREHPDLAMGSKEEIENGESAFYKKVAEEFDNAVSRSQSVSDEIHQSSLRKSKNPITRAFTLFRSDSAQTYNVLRQKIGEARYYMRTGAKDNVILSAKKAAGTAFVAMLINAAWSEGINFLMALWKNKGKKYRDDDDELTVQSVTGEMVSGMLGSFAGVVTGGEEVFDLIGNIITGEKWYGIDTPGMEQLNNVLDIIYESGSGMRDIVADGWDILKNGGDLGDYLSKRSSDILGNIKDLAAAAAMYLPGLPVTNLEAYLVGAIKWISPELGAAYDDLFSDVAKNDLTNAEGSVLESRIASILSNRRISESDDTAKALAALYNAGYNAAVPGDVPTSISINGEQQTLGAYQQQAYGTIWSGIVSDAVDDIVSSESFAKAEPKNQVKMLSDLYTYAAAQAKAELFDEYELDSSASENAGIVAAGATVAQCIIWNTTTGEMKAAEKSAELLSWDLPEETKREIFRCKISNAKEESITAFDEVGLSFDQFLQAYGMYGQINSKDLKAGEKALEFSHWVNAQGYATKQASVIKDELKYFSMTPATPSRYEDLVGAGMEPEDAYELTGVLDDLEPAEGKDEVSSLQKWRASVDFSSEVEDQLVALSAVMTDAQFQKVEIANDFGITPDTYVTLQEIKLRYDSDGNGSYKNEEIQAAIDALPGYYTTKQKAALWQLSSGSTSSKNNPYSQQVGKQILDAKKAAKEAATQNQASTSADGTDEDSFSNEILKQLLGRD